MKGPRKSDGNFLHRRQQDQLVRRVKASLYPRRKETPRERERERERERARLVIGRVSSLDLSNLDRAIINRPSSASSERR